MYTQELYQIIEPIRQATITRLNKGKKWEYGYNKEHNVVVISKTGQVGDVINVNGLYIALPLEPDVVVKRSEDSADQYWERELFPKELNKILGSVKKDGFWQILLDKRGLPATRPPWGKITKGQVACHARKT